MKFHHFSLLVFILVTCLLSCKKDPNSIYAAVYEIQFVSDWSAATHPGAYPANAHFSPLVGMSHQYGTYVFFEGVPASDGIKEMAETGATATLEDELQFSINGGAGLNKFTGSGFNAPGASSKVEVGVKGSQPSVTVMSMIAPSPDWFVAARTTLIDPADNLWYDEAIVHATAYDAGTDAGVDFTSADMPLDSAVGVHQLTDGPLATVPDSVYLGKFVFTRIE